MLLKKIVQICCLILSGAAIFEHHELPRTHHKSGHCAMWLAKKSFLLHWNSLPLHAPQHYKLWHCMTLDAFVFFSKCRIVMCSVGKTGSQTESSEVEDWDSTVICVLAFKSCSKCAINCSAWQHSSHQLSLDITFLENTICFLSWGQSLSTMTLYN